MGFSRSPFYSEEMYIKAKSREDAIKRLKKYLNEVCLRFYPFLLSEITREEYNKILSHKTPNQIII